MAYRNIEDKWEYNRKYYKDNFNKVSKQKKEHYQNNKKNILKKNEEYFQNNKEKILKYRREKYRINLNYNLNAKIRGEIRRSLKGNKKGRNWEDLVGYTIIELKNHLEKTMPKGYKWEECHIDHIIPISAFNYTRPENPDFKRCWDLENLRLLPAKENRIKFNKLEKSFQPMLQLC